jgi:hypothetical protein
MWEQYKKTLGGMQILIWLATACVLFFSHVWALALTFLVTMQIGAFVGAMWGYRLKGKVDRARMTAR